MQQVEKPIADFLDERPAILVAADASVAHAIELMRAEQSSCVLVMENEVLAGIFTERDFLNRVVAARRLPAETKICEVMTPDPKTLRAQDNVSYAIERMASRGFRHIPIIDDDSPAAVLTVWKVMTHLSGMLAEVAEVNAAVVDEWTDIGGG